MSYRESYEENRSVLVLAISGHVVGIDTTTGQERWRNDLKGGGYGVVELEIRAGLVFATAQLAHVYCLDYLTGETRWVADASRQGRGTMLVDGERVIVAKGGVVDCFTLGGQRLWTQELRGLGTGAVAMGLPGNVRQADATHTGTSH